MRRPDALHLAPLEHANELRLDAERELRDLVEEERAAVGRLEQAGLVGLAAAPPSPKSSRSSSGSVSEAPSTRTKGPAARRDER